MEFSEFLARAWRPSFGCTEPAAVGYAAAVAGALAGGPPERVTVACDVRVFKNAFAAGIPRSGGRSGVQWAAALGALVADPAVQLEVFRAVGPDAVADAKRLIDGDRVRVIVDRERSGFHVECRVTGPNGVGRAVLDGDHTCLTTVELDGRPAGAPGVVRPCAGADEPGGLAGRRIAELVAFARALGEGERRALRAGTAMNVAIAEHGVGMLPVDGRGPSCEDGVGAASWLVAGGVFARMSGVELPVMTLAGSGNKGITCAVPIAVRARRAGADQRLADEALAVACVLTAAATARLGTVSAICGAANAAGIGLAAGLVVLDGGASDDVSRAVTNMVGAVSGMVCDGAKSGCALKCATGVDAAFRAARFARAGIEVPATDGIVGADGDASLANLGRLAVAPGTRAIDDEVVAILEGKAADRLPGR